jgi:hypothetical protein
MTRRSVRLGPARAAHPAGTDARSAIRGRDVLCCYAALWLTTATAAVLARTSAHRDTAPAPHDALAASPHTALDLLAHNAPVALWPLAVTALDWPRLTGAAAIADALIAAHLLGHGLLVGSALGQHPDTWRYLPHLPLEWLALAIPAAAWCSARRHAESRLSPASLARATAVCLLALAGAAAIETYLVPVT